MDNAAILLLAGGNATRFPGKLEQQVNGEPMILRLCRRLREAPWPLYVAGKGSFAPALDAAIEAPLIVDRRPGRGPLAALHAASAAITSRWIFAVAADMPQLEIDVLQRLLAARRAGDEAIVPEHDGRTEPLAALYDRRAILREGFALQRMQDLVARLAARLVPLDGKYFFNVNRASDLATMRAGA